ncbi:MAG TPA: cyclic nucleotide-binding domain-containing protein [Chthoniobacterales bacterium]|nr:cyclic nucleotide-binding domain-containing protein [Chthoniobacterales bacterium]
MTRDEIVKEVIEHPFLQGLSHDQLSLLKDCALSAHFKAGEVIFREGDQAERFYLITSGKVVLESGAGSGPPVVIESIGAGDLLGWSWMMPPYQWHFTARAVEPTEAISFASTILRQYCERDHSLGFELHKRMSAVMMRRLQAARKKMIAIHAHGEKLQPVGLSPFMEQEFDTDGYVDPDSQAPTQPLPADSKSPVK